MMLQLQLFGGCALLSDGEPLTGTVVQRRRLALLALLGLSPGSAVSRDKLIAYFWPEDDRESARHFLSDSLSTIRKGIGKEAVLSAGEDIRLNVEFIGSD